MDKILKIITYPANSLKQRSQKIPIPEIKSNKFYILCSQMEETMLNKDGAGLAAPQIGKNIRLIVVNTKEKVLILANPKITRKSLLKEWGEEGCLSVPNVFGKVKRYKNISCSYHDLEGVKKKIKARGLLARVIQHEIDHLDGILFIDKAIDLKKS